MSQLKLPKAGQSSLAVELIESDAWLAPITGWWIATLTRHGVDNEGGRHPSRDEGRTQVEPNGTVGAKPYRRGCG